MHRALASVNLPAFDVDGSLDTLSGGQLTRVRLAAVMFDDPPLVLLDEPTNNLDKAGRALVWESLTRSRAGTIVVSHDRDLLDAMDRIVELQTAGVKSYGGNWTFQQACKQAEKALAEQRLGSARRQMHQARRSIQQARERKHKSNAQAQKHRQDGSTGKMALDAAKQSAEDCGLACILGGQSVPALLLLDEPANHLDLVSLQAIEADCRRMTVHC